MNRFTDYLKGNIYFVFFYRILLIYAMYAVCRVAFLIFNFHLIKPEGFGHTVWLFIAALKFDTSAIMWTNLPFIVLMLLPIKARHRKGYQTAIAILYFIPNIVAILANLADVAYFPFTLKRTTGSVFAQFADENNMGSLVLMFIRDYWPLTVLFLLFCFGLVWLYRKQRVAPPKIEKPVWFYYASSTVLFLILFFLCWGGTRGGFSHSTRPITISNAGEFVNKNDEIPLVLNTPFSILRTLNKEVIKDVQYLPSATADQLFNPVHEANLAPTQQGKNVMIFMLESYTKEFVGALNKNIQGGKYQGFTPFLDSLVGQSYVFTRSFASGRKSIDVMPSVLSAIPAMQTNYILSHYANNRVSSLQEYLESMGYSTAFFHGAPNGSMGLTSYSKLSGIDHYYGKDEYNNDDDFDGVWGIWDEEFFQYSAKMLDTLHKPFCAGLFSVSSHHPFQVPERYVGKFRKGKEPLQECIHYTDYSLQQFFKTAASKPWFKNTIFIITADHASMPILPEYCNDLGIFSIPIIIYTPDGSLKGIDTTTVVQQTDILPTVLSLVGTKNKYVAFGNNMFDTTKAHFAVNYTHNNFQIMKDDYMLQFDGEKTTAFYRYSNDPDLKNNLVSQNLPQQAQVLQYLQAYIQQFNHRMIHNELKIK